MRHGRCMDPSGLDGVVYLYSAVSAITDLGFGILPVFVVWGLYMPQRSKIALACILSLGCWWVHPFFCGFWYLHV